MATMFSYGFFGNIIRQSEDWRFLGPFRYNLSGFFQFLLNSSYHAEVIITQPTEKCNTKTLIDNVDRCLFGNDLKRRDTSDVKTVVDERIDSKDSSLPLTIKREGKYKTINCLNMSGRCDNSNYGMSPSVHLGMNNYRKFEKKVFLLKIFVLMFLYFR